MAQAEHWLPRGIRTSLARRATVLIVGFCALVGIGAALAGAALMMNKERTRIDVTLTQLIETIDGTARVAAFTSDQTLAVEVATGLLRNRFVARVVLVAGHDVLVDTGRGAMPSDPLTRPLASPFDEQEIVGSIAILPNHAAIQQEVARHSATIALLIGLVVAALAAAVAWVVQSTITRPLKLVSDALHTLDPLHGERLRHPSGNEDNELGRLVSDVNALIDRVVRRERIFRGIVSQALDAITLVDIETDRFVEFNESAHTDLGMDHRRFSALSASSLLVPRTVHNRGLPPWTNRVYEVRCAAQDGSQRDLRVSTRLISLEGRPHAVCTWTDVTQQKAAQEELRLHRDGLQELVNSRTKDLQDAKDAAEQANRTKSEFLSNMSHELRTPMHAILSFARLGADRAGQISTEKIRHYFRAVLTSGDRLLQLLNDLLDLSKLEAGMMQMQMAHEDLARLLEQVIEEFSPLAAEKSLALVFNRHTDDAGLLCDAVRLHQVMNNLLSNAVKFTPVGGKIEVELRLSQVDDCTPALAIAVRDQGIGIPEAELEKVFDKFVQSSKTSSGAGGTGLGLSISREIVALHGGQICAHNNPDGGACFTLLLPCAPSDAPAPRTALPSAA